MWEMITQSELATASIGGMDALSLLGVGLVGLIWLAVRLIAWMAACDHLSQLSIPEAAEREPLRPERGTPVALLNRRAEGRRFTKDQEAPYSEGEGLVTSIVLHPELTNSPKSLS